MLPDTVSLAVLEFTAELEEALLGLRHRCGVEKVVNAMMEHKVETLMGAKGGHDPNRLALRHGSDDGVVTLAGRQVQITGPRVRSADRTSEVALCTYDCFASSELLGGVAMEKMLAKVSTYRYEAGLEPVGAAVEASSRGTSRSAGSRCLVAATGTAALAELVASNLSGVDLMVLMVDSVNFASRCFVVALGIDADGVKHSLGVVEGDTENVTLVTGLRDRRLDVTRPVLCVLDGAKAFTSAVKAVFAHPSSPGASFTQDQKREALLVRQGRAPGGAAHACRALQPRPPGRPGRLRGPSQRARPRPNRGCSQPARGARRNLYRDTPASAADARRDPALDQLRGINDRDLPRSFEEYAAMQVRHHGTPLARSGSLRGKEAVPTREWPLAPAGDSRRTRRPHRDE